MLAVLHPPQHAAHESTPLPWSHLHPQGQSYLPLQDDRIHYAGQPVALVVAANARSGDTCRDADPDRVEVERPVVFSPQMAKEAVEPPQLMWPLASSIGDAEKAIAEAAVKIEQAYTMPDRHHNQMEPHATRRSGTTTAR